MSDKTAEQIAYELAEPFAADELGYKPQVVSQDKTRALVVFYVDARLVAERLDKVVGIANWRDSYQFMPDGSVLCRLELRLGGDWVGKEDVGSQSEQPDQGDRIKAAVSDAFKRAAVKWSVARYVYEIKNVWAEYDGQKNRIKCRPQLPDWALPRKAQSTQQNAAPAPQPPAQQTPQPAAADTQLQTPTETLYQRILRVEASAVKRGICDEGALQVWLRERFGPKHSDDLTRWPESLRGAVELAMTEFGKLFAESPFAGTPAGR